METPDFDREFRTGFCLGLASEGVAPSQVESLLKRATPTGLASVPLIGGPLSSLASSATAAAPDAAYLAIGAPIIGGLGAGYFGGKMLGDLAFNATEDKDAGKKKIEDNKNQQVSDELRMRIAELKNRQPLRSA